MTYREPVDADDVAVEAHDDARRRSAAATSSGESLFIPSRHYSQDVEITTARTAVDEWNRAEKYLGYSQLSDNDIIHFAEVQRVIECSLAEKHGVSWGEERERLLAHYAMGE